MTEIAIDLTGCVTDDAILYKLGDVLALGGVDGNVKVSAVNAGVGCGLNWDTLKDSLCYLNTGDIWGDSPGIEFPVRLRLTSTQSLADENPRGLGYIREILAAVRQVYLEANQSFNFTIE